MAFRSLLGTSLAAAVLMGFAACSLATSGLPEAAGGGSPASAVAASSTDASSGPGGSGGAGGDSSSSSLGGGMASSSSGGGTEDCFNNQDDNSDGKVDCADPLCSNGVTSCADIPSGWTPVWETQVGDPSLPPGTCVNGKPRKAYFTQPAGPPTCASCQCVLGAGAACSAPLMSCYFNSDVCGGAVGLTAQQNANGCSDLSGIPDINGGSCQLTGPAKILNPACTATGGGTTSSASKFSGAVFVCDSPAFPGGCAGGQLCLSAKPSQDGSLCIMRPGNDTCPPAWKKTISGFADGTDDRKCGACNCTLGCSGGGYVVHDHISCGDGSSPVSVNSSTCMTTSGLFDNNTAAINTTVALPAVGSCTAPAPSGKVTGTGQVQICCK